MSPDRKIHQLDPAFGRLYKSRREPKAQMIVAELAGLNRSELSRIESGKSEPRLSTYLALADATDMSDKEILDLMGTLIDPSLNSFWDKLTQQARNPVMETQGTFGDRLKSYRMGLGLSLRQVGARSNIDFSVVHHIEKYGRETVVSNVARLMEGLRLSPEQAIDLISPFRSSSSTSQ